MKREPSKEWDMKKNLTISHYLARTTSLDISLACWLHVSGIVHTLYIASPETCWTISAVPRQYVLYVLANIAYQI